MRSEGVSRAVWETGTKRMALAARDGLDVWEWRVCVRVFRRSRSVLFPQVNVCLVVHARYALEAGWKQVQTGRKAKYNTNREQM